MKKILLSFSSLVLASGFALGQNNIDSDAGGILIHNPIKQENKITVTNKMACPNASVTENDTVCNPSAGTVTATGGTSTAWYDAATGGNLIDTGSSYTSPVLTSDTTVYAQALCDEGMMGLPAHSSIFSGNTRGYWFVAPVDFVITGVRAPIDFATGNQSVQVIRINDAVANFTWSNTTNNFTSLAIWQDTATADVLTTFIPVAMGDTIGLLGKRNGGNSYAPGPHTTTIDGNSVDLTRLGFQDDLDINPASSIFTELNGNISRVEMYYSTIAPTRTSATIVVENCSSVSEVSFENNISVYPNPTNGIIWIENSTNESIQIKLFDVTGKNISTNVTNRSKEQLDVSGLSNGTYFVQIINNNESLVKKVILNK